MKVTFLGTGTSQGIPVIACHCRVCTSENKKDKRLRASVLIEDNGTTLVIDTGPDFRQQMLNEKVDRLDAVLFTHEHKDHTAGLDDIRAFNYFQEKSMDVYGTLRVQEAIKREFSYIFSGIDYPGIPKINLYDIPLEGFRINHLWIQPIQVMHHKLPVLGFRINDFTYITDANFIEEKEKGKIRGSKVIILNALRKETHISHFTLEEAINLLEEMKPEKAFLTHISHQLGKHEEVDAELPSFIRCGYDGLSFTL